MTFLDDFRDALGTGLLAIVVNPKIIAAIGEDLISSFLSNQALKRSMITVYNLDDNLVVDSLSMEACIAKGNGFYTWAALRSAKTLEGFNREEDPERECTWENVKQDVCRLVAMDMMLRFTQARSLVSIVENTANRVNWMRGEIPAYITTYLNYRPDISGSSIHQLLGGAWVTTFPSEFLKMMNFKALPSDIRSRMLLSPAGWRNISVMRYLTEDTLVDDLGEEESRVHKVLRQVYSEGYFWEWHPAFRPNEFHTKVGSFNKAMEDFLAHCIKEDFLVELVRLKVIYGMPKRDLRHQDWKGWTISSFDWRKTMIGSEGEDEHPRGPPEEGPSGSKPESEGQEPEEEEESEPEEETQKKKKEKTKKGKQPMTVSHTSEVPAAKPKVVTPKKPTGVIFKQSD